MGWLTVAILFILSSCAYTPEPFNKADIALESSWAVLHVVDWGQTLTIAEDPYSEEDNPILGKDPSKSDVNLYMGAWMVAHPIITWLLPPKYRAYWLGASIGITGGAVLRNHANGIRIEF